MVRRRTSSCVTHECIIDELDTLIACGISCTTFNAVSLRSTSATRGGIRLDGRTSSRRNRGWCCFFDFLPAVRQCSISKRNKKHTPATPLALSTSVFHCLTISFAKSATLFACAVLNLPTASPALLSYSIG